LVAALWQAKEEAAKTKRELDMKASEELARKIQADLDRMGTPITHTLPAERQKELDEIAKSLSAEQ
jgi:dihydroxyacetone kinase